MTMQSIAIDTSKARYSGGLGRALKVRGRGREALAEIMLSYGEPQMASRKRALNEWRARTGLRFRIGDGQGQFLAGDGQSVTDESRGSWFGTEEQAARAIARFACAHGMRAIPIIKPIAAGHRGGPRANFGA